MSRAAIAAVAFLVASGHAPRAQEGPPLRFEVASVKPNRTGPEGPRNLSFAPGGVRVTNLPISTVLWMAHRVQADQVVDVPGWARDESFDIVGKAPDGTPLNIDTMMAMMRDLLADRFQLRTRPEMRELSVYKLVQARPGAPPGPRLKPATFDCTGRGGGPLPGTAPPSVNRCGATARPGGVSIGGFPILTLARLVGPMVGRVVVDETGLAGTWDVELTFAPEQAGTPFFGGAPPAPASASSEAPSIFTALQEQLGLKLEAGRAPVDVIVVEQIERPTPD